MKKSNELLIVSIVFIIGAIMSKTVVVECSASIVSAIFLVGYFILKELETIKNK